MILIAVIFVGYFGFFEPATIPLAGYYIFDDNVYYHASSDSRDYWYLYDSAGEWTETEIYNRYPDVYKKRKTANEYLHSEEWSRALPCTDFKKSLAYSDYVNDYKVDKGYYSYNGDTYYHLLADCDDGWYSYSVVYNRWEPVGSSSIPDALTHNSVASDFYLTPIWDSALQFSDFKDTSYYSDYIDEQNSHNSWDNDDDSNYDWDSYDSWDNDSMDWDSDW